DDPNEVHRHDEGMADLLDTVEGLEFLLGADALVVQRVEVAEDEFNSLEEAAGGLAFPGLAEAAAAEGLDQAIAGDRLRVGFSDEAHELVLLLPPAMERLTAG